MAGGRIQIRDISKLYGMGERLVDLGSATPASVRPVAFEQGTAGGRAAGGRDAGVAGKRSRETSDSEDELSHQPEGEADARP